MKLNKIICGDCLELIKDIPDGSIDLIFADPPFNLKKDYGVCKDNLIQEDYYEWCDKWIRECFRILKSTGSFYHMNYAKNVFELGCIMSRYGIFQNLIVWKNTKAVSAKRFMNAYQPILFFSKTDKFKFHSRTETKPRSVHSFIPDKEKAEKYGDECRITDVWDDIKFISGGCVSSKEAILEEGTKKKAHPAQMPLKLVERAILFSSDEGDIVLDPFVGIGTTAVAAKKLGRKFIGIDINPKYVELSIRRLEIEEVNMAQGIF